MSKKSLVQGALILTAASIITRLLGFVYRIYMVNSIGAEGMGLYQLIMPIYSLTWSICCAGFTTTISKLIAAENAKGEHGNMGRTLKLGLLITGAISAVVSVVLFAFSEYIAVKMFNDARVIISLKGLSFAIVFMSFGSCVRGYFIGLRENTVPAISQVLEQCVRMAVIYILAGTFMPMGLEFACFAAVIGIIAGELISFLYVLYAYKSFKSKNGYTKRPTISSAQLAGIIFTMALPLSLNRISGSLLSTVENMLIPQRLQMFGMTQAQAVSEFGKVTGMAFPLIFFPSALLFALSTTLVPAVSEAFAVNNKKRITSTISKSILFTLVIGMCASVVFVVFPYELGYMIYKQDISDIMLFLGFVCPLWYLNITLSGILNGLGEQMLLFKNGLLSSAINIGFVYFVVPEYGVLGFLMGWSVSVLLINIISALRIKNRTGIKILYIRWFVKPIISALASGLTMIYLSGKLITPLFGDVLGLVLSIALLVFGFLFFIIILGCISIDDIKGIFAGLTTRKKFNERTRTE